LRRSVRGCFVFFVNPPSYRAQSCYVVSPYPLNPFPTWTEKELFVFSSSPCFKSLRLLDSPLICAVSPQKSHLFPSLRSPVGVMIRSRWHPYPPNWWGFPTKLLQKDRSINSEVFFSGLQKLRFFFFFFISSLAPNAQAASHADVSF